MKRSKSALANCDSGLSARAESPARSPRRFYLNGVGMGGARNPKTPPFVVGQLQGELADVYNTLSTHVKSKKYLSALADKIATRSIPVLIWEESTRLNLTAPQVCSLVTLLGATSNRKSRGQGDSQDVPEGEGGEGEDEGDQGDPTARLFKHTEAFAVLSRLARPKQLLVAPCLLGMLLRAHYCPIASLKIMCRVGPTASYSTVLRLMALSSLSLRSQRQKDMPKFAAVMDNCDFLIRNGSCDKATSNQMVNSVSTILFETHTLPPVSVPIHRSRDSWSDPTTWANTCLGIEAAQHQSMLLGMWQYSRARQLNGVPLALALRGPAVCNATKSLSLDQVLPGDLARPADPAGYQGNLGHPADLMLLLDWVHSQFVHQNSASKLHALFIVMDEQGMETGRKLLREHNNE